VKDVKGRGEGKAKERGKGVELWKTVENHDFNQIFIFEGLLYRLTFPIWAKFGT